MSTEAQSSWRQKIRFNPGPAGLLVNPFFHARRGLMRELRALLPQLTGEVLDVGCGQKPYRHLVRASRYVGLDIDTPTTRAIGAADVFYDGGALPFAPASFDGILCSQVLEHVFTPEELLRDLARVLRPGGRLVLTVPFAWDEHEQPHDFARYTSFGLRALLERNGFEVLDQRKSVTDARAVAQLASAWLYKALRTRVRAANLLVQVALIAPVNLAGAVAAAVLPANAEFYLDNVVLARTRAPAGGS